MITEDNKTAEAVEKVGTAIVDAAKDVQGGDASAPVVQPSEAVLKAQASGGGSFNGVIANVQAAALERNEAATEYVNLKNGTPALTKRTPL